MYNTDSFDTRSVKLLQHRTGRFIFYKKIFYGNLIALANISDFFIAMTRQNTNSLIGKHKRK